MDNDPASIQAQSCGLAEPVPDNSFSFTPIKALRSIPRLWERKPSTPNKNGPKSRKLWKRFHSKFTGMQSLETSTALERNAFQTALNTSNDSGYARGVKRLRVDAEPDTNSTFQMHEPGRSFLETKWEADTSRHRRKIADAPIEIYNDNERSSENDVAKTGAPKLFGAQESPSKPTIFSYTMPCQNIENTVPGAKGMKSPRPESINREECPKIESVGQSQDGAMAPTPVKVVRDLTQQQEGTLVRSALRSSLDGSDTALLNDFLSRAQAKRAEKAATFTQQEPAVEKSSTSHLSPDVDCATPPSRRILEVLDTNSPSPVKVIVSPNKKEVLDIQVQENGMSKTVLEEVAPPSPTCRRSSRVKAPATTAPAPNTIALRRARGNEFIFLQRTEAQELALATKKNTRNNKGNAMIPQARLEALSKQANDEQSVPGAVQIWSDSTEPSRKSHARKSVSWNDDRLVEFEDDRPAFEESTEEEQSDDVEGVTKSRSAAKRSEKKTSSHRSSRSHSEEPLANDNESAPSAPHTATAPADAAPGRRVRRLGDSAMVSGTPVKTGSGRISKPPAPAPTVAAGPSTPTKPRRKLTPKSPSTSALSASLSKSSATGDQSFVSGIPTRASSISAGSSEGTKRKNLTQANAGCTPMPRRVRARN